MERPYWGTTCWCASESKVSPCWSFLNPAGCKLATSLLAEFKIKLLKAWIIEVLIAHVLGSSISVGTASKESKRHAEPPPRAERRRWWTSCSAADTQTPKSPPNSPTRKSPARDFHSPDSRSWFASVGFSIPTSPDERRSGRFRWKLPAKRRNTKSRTSSQSPVSTCASPSSPKSSELAPSRTRATYCGGK